VAPIEKEDAYRYYDRIKELPEVSPCRDSGCHFLWDTYRDLPVHERDAVDVKLAKSGPAG
jgi:hypothetical protein